jgi:putative nitrogenase subunit nifH
MDESDMIFGATAKLTDLVQRVQESVPKPRGVVVVTSCPAGIIGDDTEKVLDLSVPDCPVVLLKTDGNLTGDFLQGMLMAYTQLAKQIIKPNVPKQANLVNIVFEKAVAKNTNSNFRLISKFLEAMDVKVNCRFLYNTGFESIENFCSASLNLLAYKDYTGNILKEFFESEYGCEFFDRQFPTGFLETCDWLREIGKYFGKEEVAERIIEENAKNYLDRVEKIKPYLRGKKIFIVTYNHELDWILKTAFDLEMEISKIAIVNFSQDEGFRSRLPESTKMRIEQNYEHQNMSKDIEELRPDILLSNYESSLPNATCFVDTIPMCPDNGFFSGLVMAERWQKLLDFNLEGEWKNDKKLFDKYYA